MVDCGVAPGVSNMLAGHAAVQMDPCEHLDIFVGQDMMNRTLGTASNKIYEYAAVGLPVSRARTDCGTLRSGICGGDPCAPLHARPT